jgi:hypothetical protein
MVGLLLLGLLLFMGVAALASVAGFVLLLAYASGRSSSPELLEQRIADGWRWVDSEGARLAPWGPGSLAAISDHADFRWSRLLGVGESRSVVPAVADGHSLVVLYGAYGAENTLQYVAARTAGHRWRLVPQGATWQVGLDGAPFGSWQRDAGTLLDAAGQRVGTAHREPPRWNRPDRWYEVRLDEQVLGTILAGGGVRSHGARAPLVRPADALDAAGERWLLALVLVELALRVQDSVGRGVALASIP